MNEIIRPMLEADRAAVLEMMQTFYTSPAVYTNGSAAIYGRDFDACVSGSPYLEGYILARGETVLGYAMLAKSFSTEVGLPCVWLEDLYLKPEARDCGLGSTFLAFVRRRCPQALLRLEVEPENARAVHTYEKMGYTTLPYTEMISMPEARS